MHCGWLQPGATSQDNEHVYFWSHRSHIAVASHSQIAVTHCENESARCCITLHECHSRSHNCEQRFMRTTPWRHRSVTRLCPAPRYLFEELCYVADMPVGERSSPVVDLQSAGCLTVTPRYCCWPFIWHTWSRDLERSTWRCHVCTTSLLTFRPKVKARLFRRSYTDIILYCLCHSSQWTLQFLLTFYTWSDAKIKI